MRFLFLVVFFCIVSYGSFYLGNFLYVNAKGFLQPGGKVDRFYLSATQCFEQYETEGDENALEAAGNNLAQAIEIDPNIKKVNLLMAKVCVKQKIESNAVVFYEKAMENPSERNVLDIPALFEMTRIYTTNAALKQRYGFVKCFNSAGRCYDIILGFEPGNFKALLGKAYCLGKVRQYSKACSVIDKLLSLSPDEKMKGAAEKLRKEYENLQDENLSE